MALPTALQLAEALVLNCKGVLISNQDVRQIFSWRHRLRQQPFCQLILYIFFLLGAAWVRSQAERPSVSEVSGQLRVQFGCKLSSKLTKKRIKQGKQQIKDTKFQIKMQRSAVRPEVLSQMKVEVEIGRT